MKNHSFPTSENPQDQLDEIAFFVLGCLSSTNLGAGSQPRDIAYTAYAFAEAFLNEKANRRSGK